MLNYYLFYPLLHKITNLILENTLKNNRNRKKTSSFGGIIEGCLNIIFFFGQYIYGSKYTFRGNTVKRI